MKNNLNKTREEIIYELVLSFNNGDSCTPEDRVRLAIAQYTDLVNEKIIYEWCDHNWQPIGSYYSPLNIDNEYKFKCTKCGKIKTEQTPF